MTIRRQDELWYCDGVVKQSRYFYDWVKTRESTDLMRHLIPRRILIGIILAGMGGSLSRSDSVGPNSIFRSRSDLSISIWSPDLDLTFWFPIRSLDLDPISRSRSFVYRSGIGHDKLQGGHTWCKPHMYKGAISWEGDAWLRMSWYL